MWQQLLADLKGGSVKALARSITFVENEQPGYEQFLAALPQHHTSKIIGITGPPGAGKSTLVDALIKQIINDEKNVAVLCVDPSSPFNLGAVLGDRIRMSEWYTHPNVYIRSLATRGAMGGLHPKIIEITELLKAAAYDYIIVETVGVGQSEIEIAGLADITVVVLVPEGGDDVQTMKAGLMEIADLFVVNKADRPGADVLVNNLRLMLVPAFSHGKKEVPVIKTVASQQQGMDILYQKIKTIYQQHISDKKVWLLTEKAWHLIQEKRMKDMDKEQLKQQIDTAIQSGSFNLYAFIRQSER
jgi:LAO/AO transport system kinase